MQLQSINKMNHILACMRDSLKVSARKWEHPSLASDLAIAYTQCMLHSLRNHQSPRAQVTFFHNDSLRLARRLELHARSCGQPDKQEARWLSASRSYLGLCYNVSRVSSDASRITIVKNTRYGDEIYANVVLLPDASSALSLTFPTTTFETIITMNN